MFLHYDTSWQCHNNITGASSCGLLHRELPYLAWTYGENGAFVEKRARCIVVHVVYIVHMEAPCEWLVLPWDGPQNLHVRANCRRRRPEHLAVVAPENDSLLYPFRKYTIVVQRWHGSCAIKSAEQLGAWASGRGVGWKCELSPPWSEGTHTH